MIHYVNCIGYEHELRYIHARYDIYVLGGAYVLYICVVVTIKLCIFI